jgi:chromosomal replication initiator protein
MADGAGFGTALDAALDRGVDPLWAQARTTLKSRVGAGSFQSWIAPLRLAALEDGVATLVVPTAFLGSYVARNFQEDILAALAEAGQPATRLLFAPQGRAVSPVAAPVRVAAPEPEEEGSRLDPRLTFDRFVVGKSNELAHRRRPPGGRRAYGLQPALPPWRRGPGQDPPHAGHRAGDARPEPAGPRALSFGRAVHDPLRERAARPPMMDFKQAFRAVDVLMVDDIQFIAGKDSTQEEFFHTFNALVDQGKQIVLTADRSPVEISSLEERVTSRLQSGLVVQVHAADYELRLGVLQAKLAVALAADPRLQIAEGVLEFLAARITSNLRVLEGALTRLCAQGNLVGREITLDLARDILGDVLRHSDRKVSIEEIQRKVAEHYHIRLADLIGPKRLRSFARPRQVAMYLAKTMTSRSLPDIGRRFGGRDHTTIIHGVKRIEELRVADSQIADDLEMLRRALEA